MAPASLTTLRVQPKEQLGNSIETKEAGELHDKFLDLASGALKSYFGKLGDIATLHDNVVTIKAEEYSCLFEDCSSTFSREDELLLHFRNVPHVGRNIIKNYKPSASDVFKFTADYSPLFSREKQIVIRVSGVKLSGRHIRSPVAVEFSLIFTEPDLKRFSVHGSSKKKLGAKGSASKRQYRDLKKNA
ncbi:hypothetical protein HDU67_009319 [Dinochytrium kinnereticum]|nr:hypothetical protein HDU67_009319 [Dinochytrium kinnereticum]